jgi:hypothetical protein
MISSGTIVACTGEPTQRLRTEGRKDLKGVGDKMLVGLIFSYHNGFFYYYSI